VILTTDTGDVRLQKPLVYQLQENGHKHLIAGDYVLLAAGAESSTPALPLSHQPSAPGSTPSAINHQPSTIGFRVAAYDRSRPLVIDPTLVYATYLGGSGREDDFGIAVDAAGNAYVTGGTGSADFPTTPEAFDTRFNG